MNEASVRRVQSIIQYFFQFEPFLDALTSRSDVILSMKILSGQEAFQALANAGSANSCTRSDSANGLVDLEEDEASSFRSSPRVTD